MVGAEGGAPGTGGGREEGTRIEVPVEGEIPLALSLSSLKK